MDNDPREKNSVTRRKTPSTKLNFKRILQIVILVLSAAFILSYFIKHQEELVLLSTIKFPDNVLFFVLFLVYHVIYGFQLFLILRHLGLNNLNFCEWFKIFNTSRFINFHIMQGANIYRSVALKQKCNFPYTRSIGLIAATTWFELITILLILLGLTIISQVHLYFFNLSLISITLILIIIVLLTPPVAYKILTIGIIKNSRLRWLQEKLSDVVQYILDVIRHPALAAQIMALTAVTFLIHALWMHLCFGVFHTETRLMEVALFTSVLLVSRMFNIVPGNIGIREVACGILTQSFGWSVGSGIMISAIFRVVEYIAVGLLMLLYTKTLWVDLKRLNGSGNDQ